MRKFNQMITLLFEDEMLVVSFGFQMLKEGYHLNLHIFFLNLEWNKPLRAFNQTDNASVSICIIFVQKSLWVEGLYIGEAWSKGHTMASSCIGWSCQHIRDNHKTINCTRPWQLIPYEVSCSGCWYSRQALQWYCLW